MGKTTAHSPMADSFERRHSLAVETKPENSFVLPWDKVEDQVPATVKNTAFPFSPTPIEETIVGSATIYGTGNKKPVKAIVKAKRHPSYSANDLAQKTTFNLYVQEKNVGYTTVESEDADLHINYMESLDRKHFQGIGTALHQIAIESSLQRGHEGRVTLDSLDSAVGFHYKLGFRTGSKKLDDKIVRELEKAKRKGIKEPEINVSRNLLGMHLPKKKIQVWQHLIARNPILTNSP